MCKVERDRERERMSIQFFCDKKLCIYVLYILIQLISYFYT